MLHAGAMLMPWYCSRTSGRGHSTGRFDSINSISAMAFDMAACGLQAALGAVEELMTNQAP